MTKRKTTKRKSVRVVRVRAPKTRKVRAPKRRVAKRVRAPKRRTVKRKPKVKIINGYVPIRYKDHKTGKMVTKKVKIGSVVYVGKIRKVPQTANGLKMDRRKRALPPGKRISDTGQRYYEYRSNHADATRRGL